jgi:uncharacterized membrane protein YhaH (DUF805 family)
MPKGKTSIEDSKFELNAKRWKNRRRMAWLCLLSMLVLTYYIVVVVDENRIEVLQPVITWFYTVMGSIVGAYHGLATFEDVKTKVNE